MGRIRRAIGPLALVLAALASPGLFQAEAGKPAPPPVKLAVIVHPKNKVTDLKLREVKAIFRLDRQFWPDDRRIVLYLPPATSPEKKVLLDKIYNMTNKELQKYWMGKIFKGDIPAIPPVAKNAKAAGELVKGSEGAVAVVRTTEIPEGIKVVTIDGKKPDEAGYALVGEEGGAGSVAEP